MVKKKISPELKNNNFIFGENGEKVYHNDSTERKSTKIEIEDNFRNNNIDNENIEEKNLMKEVNKKIHNENNNLRNRINSVKKRLINKIYQYKN